MWQGLENAGIHVCVVLMVVYAVAVAAYRISRRRAPVERVFAVVKRVFDGGHVLVTTVPRVRVKMTFACLCFNLLQLGTLGGAW